ncbi:hypothetical protein OCU04_010935 [Sclerotinia nivalis]|uniref:LysM domain-containing protein n=1 Tax=Sclerotinia nivalis TaxID=352851 RepID=A0A9X0AD95_9HELO|nr:hypothetical protein OCU04_010935 [Sclerotinia nivalis]
MSVPTSILPTSVPIVSTPASIVPSSIVPGTIPDYIPPSGIPSILPSSIPSILPCSTPSIYPPSIHSILPYSVAPPITTPASTLLSSVVYIPAYDPPFNIPSVHLSNVVSVSVYNLSLSVSFVHLSSVISVTVYNPPSTIATTLSPSVAPPAVTLPTTLLSSVIGSSTGSACSAPCSSATRLASCSASIYPLPSSSGDVLFDIAKDNGVTWADLEVANLEVIGDDLIQPGLVINLPSPTFTPVPAPAPAPISDPCAAQAVHTVTIKPGDTLNDIAAQYGVPPSALQAANPSIPNYDTIVPGQNIHIPAKSVARVQVVYRSSSQEIHSPSQLALPGQTIRLPTGGACPGTYTTKEGERNHNLAPQLGDTTRASQNAHPQITNPNLLQPGRVINVPGGAWRSKRILNSAKFRAAF